MIVPSYIQIGRQIPTRRIKLPSWVPKFDMRLSHGELGYYAWEGTPVTYNAGGPLTSNVPRGIFHE